MAIKFIPQYDYVLVAPLDRELIQDGVWLPESTKEDMKLGIVVAIGEGYVSQNGAVKPLRLQPGQRVAFGPYAGNPIQIEGQTFLIMREAAVFGRLSNDD